MHVPVGMNVISRCRSVEANIAVTNSSDAPITPPTIVIIRKLILYERAAAIRAVMKTKYNIKKQFPD